MSSATADRHSGPIVGIVGAGVTGHNVGRVVIGRGYRVVWFDIAPAVARRTANHLGGLVVDAIDDMAAVDTVVLTHPVPHAALATRLLAEGRDVVSVSDHLDDVEQLLALADVAIGRSARLVVGAALAPGLSGLLARHLADQLDVVDEIHVATHGTGGPACARRHHNALGDRSIAWHDGEWVERPGGSGRELCWFPDPIGAVDCYRAAVADPVALRLAFPQASRISARVSATRRDRLTARLPMLAPPRRAGDIGAVRVEVRGGLRSGERVTHVAGAAGRAGVIAGTVAALWAAMCVERHIEPGVHVSGSDGDVTQRLLGEINTAGVSLHEFTGMARATAW